MVRIGFIGLGIMGRPMASRLLEAGYMMSIYDRVPEAMTDLAARGAFPCGDPSETGARSDVLFLMLPDTPDVEEVLFGDHGAAGEMKAGSIIVDMSSISPTATRKFAESLMSRGIDMLDAPVSGGEAGARNGTLSIMVGGEAAVLEAVLPFLEIMGKNIVHIGSHGDGQVCKAANQIIVALTIEAVSEALVFAAKAGADVKKVRSALLGGFAQSRVLEVHGDRMIKKDFAPGFRVSFHRKDLAIALDAARDLGVSLPNTASTGELFNAVAAGWGGELDHSALILALERLAQFTIGGE